MPSCRAAKGPAPAEDVIMAGFRITRLIGGSEAVDWPLPDQVAQIEIMTRARAGEIDKNHPPLRRRGRGS